MYRFLPLVFACFVLGTSFVGTPAEAKRGGGIVAWGDEIFDLGPIPSEPGMRVGRLCQHVAFFWADIATWSCRIVVANADLTRYGEVPAGMKAAAETLYADAPSNRSWWNQYGFYVFLGLFVISFLTRTAAGVVASRPSSVSLDDVPGSPSPIPPPPISPAAAPSRAFASASPARASFGRRGLA